MSCLYIHVHTYTMSDDYPIPDDPIDRVDLLGWALPVDDVRDGRGVMSWRCIEGHQIVPNDHGITPGHYFAIAPDGERKEMPLMFIYSLTNPPVLAMERIKDVAETLPSKMSRILSHHAETVEMCNHPDADMSAQIEVRMSLSSLQEIADKLEEGTEDTYDVFSVHYHHDTGETPHVHEVFSRRELEEFVDFLATVSSAF